MINGDSSPASKLAASPPPRPADLAPEKPSEHTDGRVHITVTPPKIDELKQLLLKEELDNLNGLHQRFSRLDDQFADRVARDLATALQKRNERGGLPFDELVAALQTGTESAIQRSITEDKSRLTSALFPIMGPAIRNYVTDLFRGMVKDLNETIRNTTSLERIKWRIQAKLAGKSYSEYVLLKTRSFHVEEVYLMQRDTGLLLLHVARNPADEAGDEADLVSGMFTAIRSFVRDSFKHDEDNSELDSFAFGEREVLIEVGPTLVLAAVAHGVPPTSSREELQTILETLHADLATPLRNFNGDTSKLEPARPTLRQALLENRIENTPKNTSMWRAWLVINLLSSALLAWLITNYREQHRWNQFETQLRNTPGITITEINRNRWTHHRSVHGMRDPMSIDPSHLLTQHPIPPEKVHFHLNPITSLEPAFATARAKTLNAQLAEQQQITELKHQQTTHQLQTQLHNQEQQAQTNIKALISSLFADIHGLTITYPPPQNNQPSLTLSGALSSADLQLVQSRLTPIQPLFNINLTNLQHNTPAAIQKLRTTIETTTVPYHDASLQKIDELILDQIAGMIRSLDKLATETNQTFSFEVLSHPLIGQNREPNSIIENNRAQQTIEVLISAGIHPSRLHPKLSEDPNRAGHGVSLRVIEPNPQNPKTTTP